jgi:hypothetical protein
MDVKKLVLMALVAIAVITGVVMAVVSNMSPTASGDPTGAATDTPSSSVTAVPIPEQTFEPEPSTAPTVAPTQTPSSAVPSPKPSASASGVPAVAPSLKPIEIDGFGSSEVLENSLTAEEKTARDRIFKVIPIAANESSPSYKSPHGARDELVKQGLITDNMAKTWFMPKFTPHQADLNSAGFTVQTTGLKCLMRTVSPQTALEMGKVSCYFTRQYVDENGSRVSHNKYVAATGGAGAIDPDQISRVEVTVKKEGGAWKVDNLQFN